MNIKIIRSSADISEQLLKELAQEFYVEMIKGVVDVERQIIALGGEWHMDANHVLILDGSRQDSLWGFNLYLEKEKESRLEYTSLINIRPKQGNRAMEIQDETLKKRIKEIIDLLIP